MPPVCFSTNMHICQSTNLRFHNSTTPQVCNSSRLQSCKSATLPICKSANLQHCHSTNLQPCQSAILRCCQQTILPICPQTYSQTFSPPKLPNSLSHFCTTPKPSIHLPRDSPSPAKKNLSVSSNCKMCVRVTNAAPGGALAC